MDQLLSMGDVTRVSKANDSRSLRTTIPMSVVRHLKLKVGDELDWEFAIEQGNFILKVKKLSN